MITTGVFCALIRQDELKKQIALKDRKVVVRRQRYPLPVSIVDPGVQTLHIVDLIIQFGFEKNVSVDCIALGGRGGVDLPQPHLQTPYFARI